MTKREEATTAYINALFHGKKKVGTLVRAARFLLVFITNASRRPRERSDYK